MQVTDPVCGMKMDSEKAAATEDNQGQTLYFCSAACHDKYRGDPARYAKKAQSSGQSQHSHRC